MRRALICTAAAIAATLGPAAATDAAQAASPAPSAARIRSAVAGAKRSHYLWATVNICTDKRKGGVVGVRGEMPALGFSSTLSMTIQLNRFSTAHRRFVAISGSTARRTVSLGALRTGVHQSGAEFPFSADPGRLDATVTFTWTRAGKVLGTTARTTTGGHPAADFGRPAHHSAARCMIG